MLKYLDYCSNSASNANSKGLIYVTMNTHKLIKIIINAPERKMASRLAC